MASLAISGIALVGVAPAASAATQIGTPPGALVHLCITINGVLDTVCIDI
jgi:hypothetical protein